MANLRPAHFRGTNYFPSITRSADSVRGFLDPVGPQGITGYFSASQTNDELATIAAAGFNNLRLFSSFYGWVIDSDSYMKNLATFCELCRQHGLTITYVLWTTATVLDGDIPDALTMPFLLGNLRPRQRNLGCHAKVASIVAQAHALNAPYLPPGKTRYMAGFAEPGTALFDYAVPIPQWPSNLATMATEYLREIAMFFSRPDGGGPVYASYDLCNEPDLDPITRRSLAFHDLIAFTYNAIKKVHSGAVCTFGSGGPGRVNWTVIDRLAAPPYRVKLDYMSYHLFPTLDGQFLTEAQNLAREALLRRIDVVCSEFEGVLHNPFKLPVYARNMVQVYSQFRNFGGQVWGFLQSNVIVRGNHSHPLSPYFDGVLAPVDPGNDEDPVYFNEFDPFGFQAIQRWTVG